MKSKTINIIIIGSIALVLFTIIALFMGFDLTRLEIVQIVSSSVLSIVPLEILYVNRLDSINQYRIDRKREELERLKMVMVQNYNMIDLESVQYALSIMSNDKAQSMSIFSRLLRQLQENGHRADITLVSEKSDYYEQYKNQLLSCMEQYGHYIDDMQIICILRQEIADHSLQSEQVNELITRMNRLSSLNPYAKNLVFSEGGLINRLSSIPIESDYYAEVEKAMSARMDDLLELYTMKETLSNIELELLRKKQEEIAER